jgi:flagellar hook-associated protein 1 FlgK
MGWDTINIGLSGLQAAQIGLNVTGNNITNASTPGYSRQEVTQGAATAARYQGVYGTLQMGVDVTGVQRVYSDALATQVRQTQSSSSGVSIYSTLVQQLDTSLAGTTSGVAPALTSFQSSLQSLAASPATAGVRQSVLSAAQTLTNSFQSTNAQLSQMNTGVNSQIQTSVTTINNLATQLAQVNAALGQVSGATAATPPNALLDQRDQLLQTLSQQVGVTVSTETNGSMVDVTIGNGVPLVTGSQATQLNVGYVNSPADATQPQAVVQFQTASGNTQTITDGNFGGNGTLGGLLQFRNESLNQAQTAIGQMVTQIATSFNAQNALGLNANGAQGAAIFSVSGNSLQMATSDPNALAAAAPIATATGNNAIAVPTVSNTGSGTISAGSVSTGYFSAPVPAGTSLALTFVSGVTAATTATTSATATISGAVADASYTGTPLQAGQQVTLKYNGTGFDVTNPDGTTSTIASYTSGSPIKVDGFSFTITGTGATAPSVGDTFTATATSVATTYKVSGSPTASDNTHAPYPYTAGTPISLDGGTVNFTISGTPHNGDTFNVTPNVNGIGDGRNAALLNEVQGDTPVTAAGFSTSSTTATIAANPTGVTPTLNLTGVDPTYSGTPLTAGQSVTLKYNGTGFTTTTPDGANPVIASYTPGSAINIDGLSFTITGTPNLNDTFTATASGMQAQKAAANTGTGSIAVNGSGVDATYTGVPLQPGQAVQLVYNAANKNFAVTSPDGTQSIIPYTAPNATNTPTNIDGLSFTITGTPANGDTFTVSPNIASGNSYSGAYSAQMNLTGNTTSVMSSNNTTQSTLLTNVQTAQQSQSGVNLNEEAAHLIQYQQAYQASAKVIAAAQQMLDNLFAIPA